MSTDHPEHFLSGFYFTRQRTSEPDGSCSDLTVWPASSLTEKKIPACTSVTSGIAACKMILWQSFTFLSLSCSDQQLQSRSHQHLNSWQSSRLRHQVKQHRLCLLIQSWRQRDFVHFVSANEDLSLINVSPPKLQTAPLMLYFPFQLNSVNCVFIGRLKDQ